MMPKAAVREVSWIHPQSTTRRRYHGPSKSNSDSGRIQQVLEQVEVRFEQSVEMSTFLSATAAMIEFQNQLSIQLTAGEASPSSYEAPSALSREIALNILKELLYLGIRPEKVALSADGGVAIIFQPSRDDRAYLEVTNDGDRTFVSYDLSGALRIQDLTGQLPLEAARLSASLLSSSIRVFALAGA